MVKNNQKHERTWTQTESTAYRSAIWWVWSRIGNTWKSKKNALRLILWQQTALQSYQISNKNICYIYSGKLGVTLGFPEYMEDKNSAFESAIFNKIPSEELLERHILELRFFHFLKSIPASDKTNYNGTCLVHFHQNGHILPILHSTRYFHCHPNGTASLGLCTYTPFPQYTGAITPNIINTRTGETIMPQQYEQYDCKILSKRQLEILSMLAKGYGSKQIADKLCLSIYTINRHRQDILSRLNVTNSAAAVEIGLRMHLIWWH